MYDPDNNKVCSNCGGIWPATDKWFDPSKQTEDRLSDWCIKCRRAYQQEQRKEYYQKHRVDILIAYQKKRDAKSIGKGKLPRHRSTNPSPEAKRRQHKIWYANNRMKLNAKRRLREQENRSAINAGKHRRRARKRDLPDTLTGVEWSNALEYFGGCCAVCGRPPGLWHTLAIDHWIPLTNTACPGTVVTNVVPLCHGINGCNNSKCNKEPSKWLVEKFGKSKARQIEARIEAYFASLKSC